MTLEENLPQRKEKNNRGKLPSHRPPFIITTIIISFALVGIMSCGSPARLPEDVSLDESRSLV